MAELGSVLVGRAFVLGIWLSFWFHTVKRGKFVWENRVKMLHPN